MTLSRKLLLLLTVALVLGAGCGTEGNGGNGGDDMFLIESPAFGNNEPMPEKYTADGEDVSPPLEFENVPEGTAELALVCGDPDAPTPKPWVHWVIYKIPADATGLPEGASGKTGGPLEGKNSWANDNLGYRGPQPPSGTHRYFFRLYALDAPVDLAAGATKEELLAAIDGHVAGEAVLVGLYSKK